MAKVKLLNPTDDARRLDRYELIGEIASGGMATVFLARIGGVGGFQRFVAIKRLHPHLAEEEEFVQMFLDEARLAARIHHPHVVPILEVGTSLRGYYLVMEYVEGDTLARIVARAFSGNEGVPRAVIVRILLDALAGLQAAHDLADDKGQLLGLVHRDISPQNILVGVDGSARITDFGVARATARIATTEVGRMKGKLAYMAPEQTRGEDLDRRTDLFAMGIILWEVLAGQRLFKAESEAATLSRILLEPIPAFSEVASDVPAEFEAVAQRALDRDPNKRFQTAAEMADALERAATAAAVGGSTTAGIASPREVAAFVQRVMGQEIGAQRESVRAWLAQSDTSAPRVTESGLMNRADITVKLPLDRPTPPARPPARPIAPPPPPVPVPLPPPPPPEVAGVEPVPESHHTLIGQGPSMPTEDSITSPRAAVMALEAKAAAAPEAEPVIADPPTIEDDDLAVTVGRGDLSFERGPYHSSAPPPVAVYGGSVFVPSGLSVKSDGPASDLRPPVSRTFGWVVALFALLAVLGGGALFWNHQRSKKQDQTSRTEAKERSSDGQGKSAPSSAAKSGSSGEAPKGDGKVASGSSDGDGETSTPSESGVQKSSATDIALPPIKPPKGSSPGKVKPPPPPEEPDPPSPPPPPANPDESLTNPYR